jgi:hypothetical protein
MIRSTSVYTYEIDDSELATEEIRSQLSEKLRLLKPSAGVLQCDPEFVKSGVVAAVTKDLGFPIVGGTTATQAVNGTVGDLMLTLLVFTSDDTEFVSAHTHGIEEDLFGAVETTFVKSLGESSLEPKLVLAFAPIIEKYGGDLYPLAFERVHKDLPVFGTLAVSEEIITYENCATFCDDEIYSCEMTYLVLFGDVTPRFLYAGLPDQKFTDTNGVITKSNENIIEEINDVPAIDFFESVSLAKDGKLRDGLTFLPIFMTPHGPDGAEETIIRAMIDFTGDGHAVCRGLMYEGADFGFGSFTSADILSASHNAVTTINGSGEIGAVLIFSCIVRWLNIGVNPHAEAELVRDNLRPDIPFQFSYSGGEICPTPKKGGGHVNRFHNFTLIACML